MTKMGREEQLDAAVRAPPRLDAANLAGMTALMNTSTVRTSIKSEDLQKIENNIMGKPTPKQAHQEEIDYNKVFEQKMQEIASRVGVQVKPPVSATGGGEQPPARKPAAGSGPLGAISLMPVAASAASDASDASEDTEDSGDSGDTDDSEESGDTGETGGESSDSDAGSVISTRSGRSVDDIIKSLGGYSTTHKKSKHKKHATSAYGLAPRTSEHSPSRWQEGQRSVMSAVDELQGGTPATNKNTAISRDAKMSKLEQITTLKALLQEEGIKCDDVIMPTIESSMSDIENVLQVLILKNDRNRYSTLAEEVVVGAAELLETVLDGSKKIPGLGIAPDYRGYSAVVAVKLHRTRFETSELVGHIIRTYSMGPAMRVIMELLPSFFLYPRQRKRESGSNAGILSDPAVANASGALVGLNNLRKV